MEIKSRSLVIELAGIEYDTLCEVLEVGIKAMDNNQHTQRHIHAAKEFSTLEEYNEDD